MAFKKSRDLSLAQSAKRTPQDRLMRLWNQRAAEVEVRGDRGNTIVHNVLIVGRCINSRINDFEAAWRLEIFQSTIIGFYSRCLIT
jgi:homoaconitase/3-isopropylmalate dehydratase large subunit